MAATQQTDDEQTRLWNDLAGRAWVESQALLDGMFKPFEDLLVEAVAAGVRVQQVIETVRAAFDPFVNAAEVRFTAACWMVSARAAAVSSRS